MSDSLTRTKILPGGGVERLRRSRAAVFGLCGRAVVALIIAGVIIRRQ